MDIIRLIIELLMGGGLLVTLVTLRQERAKASHQAKKLELENVEQASSILMENIVEPLRRELQAVRRELQKLRRAYEKIQACDYSDNCPVAREIRKTEIGDGN